MHSKLAACLLCLCASRTYPVLIGKQELLKDKEVTLYAEWHEMTEEEVSARKERNEADLDAMIELVTKKAAPHTPCSVLVEVPPVIIDPPKTAQRCLIEEITKRKIRYVSPKDIETRKCVSCLLYLLQYEPLRAKQYKAGGKSINSHKLTIAQVTQELDEVGQSVCEHVKKHTQIPFLEQQITEARSARSRWNSLSSQVGDEDEPIAEQYENVKLFNQQNELEDCLMEASSTLFDLNLFWHIMDAHNANSDVVVIAGSHHTDAVAQMLAADGFKTNNSIRIDPESPLQSLWT